MEPIESDWYVEPFVGGANVICEIDCKKKIGIDTNYFLISFFKAIQRGWIPPSAVSEDQYLTIKNNQDKFEPELVAFVAFGCSFGGKWFGGYARGRTSDGRKRNYCAESQRNILKQKPKLMGIEFFHADYRKFNYPKKSTFYCDPPYAATTGYLCGFDSNAFWKWASQKNNIFVSEYAAPADWVSVWQQQSSSSICKNGRKEYCEQLFICNRRKMPIKSIKSQKRVFSNSFDPSFSA